MTAFEVWKFTRVRLATSIEGLSKFQLAWRPHDAAHSSFEMLYHLAAIEMYWPAKVYGPPSDPELAFLVDHSIDGFLNTQESSFKGEEFRDIDRAQRVLAISAQHIEKLYAAPEDVLNQEATAPMGDTIKVREGITRVAQHAGYHTGQIWLYRMDPRFPLT